MSPITSRSGACVFQSARALTSTPTSDRPRYSQELLRRCATAGQATWTGSSFEKIPKANTGHGGRAHKGLPEEVGTEVAIFTRVGVTRIMRYAFKLAQSRPRKLLTVVTKSNAQRHGMVMWDEIAAEVSKEFPDVTWDKMLVDAMTVRMTLRPESLDTIVATNLHADILSDLAGALAGSLGVAPTANIDPERRFPSMFEPIHGSAFDITGKGVANPIATFWTAAQMLEHLGEKDAATRLMTAVERVTEAGILTPDVGGTATTQQVTDAVCEAIAGSNILVAAE